MPGRTGSHWSACLTVPVRRGSITTTLPRPRIRSSAAGTSAWASRLPWLAWGLAPCTTMKSVRSMSGAGMRQAWPYMSWQTTFLGHWSTVPAE